MIHESRSRLRFAIAVLPLALWAPAADAAGPVCTYNDATTSFGATYANNQESLQTPLACTAGTATSAARLDDTSYGRTLITAPNTGDYKFLQRSTSTTTVPPTIAILIDDQVEMLQFPDGNISVPIIGGVATPGCDDITAGGTNGIDAIERHLHRSWPLFGQTYYYGDYNASPPNDPGAVTSSSSPYKKWFTYDSTKSYTYVNAIAKPTSADLGTATNGNVNGYYPSWSGGLIVPNGVAGNNACNGLGLTAAEVTQCNQCLNKTGYYLHDGTATGDLKKSAFLGTILNDYPPSYVHAAWAYGFLENDTLADASGNPLFKMMHETVQSQTSTCNQSRPQKVAGWVPSCPKVYPTYDWAFIQTDNKWGERQKKGEGQNQTWASYGGSGQGNTPAGDFMGSAADVLQIMQTGCKNCQSGAVVMIGFGIPCGETRPSGLPVQTMAPCTGDCAYQDTNCGCASGGNFLAEAAHYQYSTNGIRSYFIGMGPHTGAMRRAAAEGHGRYVDGRDAKEFHDALMGILQELVNIGTSAATSTLNSVQVSVAGQQEIVPRFVAKTTSGNWEGHLLKYYLFSEFAGGCSAAGQTVPVPNPAQPVCTATCVCPGGSCTATWLVDAACKLITPDKNGFLAEATWNGSQLVVPQPATCATNADCGGQTCDPVSKTCPSVATGAVSVWDLNDQLQATPWNTRNVYTAIDSNGDGKIDASDGLLSITSGATSGAANLSGGISDAVADALIPYMALGDANGNPTCLNIENALNTALPGGSSQRLRACTRVILNFTLGEDLLNENLLNSTDPNYRIGNRINMLGDVFHSSPENIGPPSSEADCNTNTRRCISSIYNNINTNGLPDYQPLEHPANVIDPATGNSVVNPGNIDAYEAYYRSETFGSKRPTVLAVGANDGMVHAVQTSCFVNTSTVGGVVRPNYWDGAGTGSCIAGSKANGTELWAFIPPDLLPKLALVLLGKHQYFIDNSPMVRDIYAPAGTASPTKRYNGTSNDFKRVAIFGEREGGTHWFALDVTDPTAPSFRWIFPQPNTEEELAVGQSWGDWVPNAPPIVPVRLAAPTGLGTWPTYTDSSGSAQAFQEKWVVLLPGGYDPYGVVGKHVYLLDAYTGAKIFQTNDTASIKQDFSFAALPAAIPWGTRVISTTPDYNKGFFDTAVYGDMGGQVWTMRFNDVGQGYPAGLVNNWFFGRAFREYAGDDTGASPYRMQHRTPILAMASAARLNEGTLRVFVGSGDRANAAEKGVGACSIYNPQACGKLMCTMTMAENLSLAGNPAVSGVSSFKGDLQATYATSWSEAYSSSGAICSPAYSEINACVSCAGVTTGGASATTASPSEPQYACTNTATGWQCALLPVSDNVATERLEVTTATPSPNPTTDIGYYSRFFAVNLFDTAVTPRSIFTSAAGAATYDGRALTESGLVNLFAANASKTFSPGGNVTVSAQTTGNSSGFYFYYPVIDERTATNTVVAQNCVTWYSMEPGQECSTNADCTGGTCDTTTHTCVSPAACGGSTSAIPARSAFLYQINASDGSTNCGLTSSNYIRSAAPLNAFLVPPPPPQELISQNSKGQLQYSIVAPAGQLSPPAAASIGGTATPFSFFYTVGLPRDLEVCRHQYSANACNP